MGIVKRAVIVGVTVLALAGCGGSTKTKTKTKTTTVATVPPVSVATQSASAKPSAPSASVAAYVNAMGKYNDPEVMRTGLTNTAPTSPAYVYLSHQANVAESALDAGQPYSASIITPEGSSFQNCEAAGTTGAVDPTTCVTFSDFKVNPAGLIVDFNVNKQDVAPRLSTGSGEVVSNNGAKFTFLTAYKTIQAPSALVVTVKVETGSQSVSLNTSTATYRDPEGKQRTATQAIAPSDVGANSNTIVTMKFIGSSPGGQVTLAGSTGADYSPVTAVIKVG
jgi:hypothetical protein